MNKTEITPHEGDLRDKYADLHLHTTASDGAFAPAELVRRAREKGYAAIAVTDHDTVTGLDEACRAGKELQVEVIPGIEFSTLSDEKEIHILGYFIDKNHPYLAERLAFFIRGRGKRAADMVEKLNNMGMEISLERVREIAGGGFIGRPHVARALLEKGYISSIKEAFGGNLLGRGGPAYAYRIKMSPAEGIDLVRCAGGIPVLAHPGYLGRDREGRRQTLSEEEIKAFIPLGLRGIEVFYGRHSSEQGEYYHRIAAAHGLLETGGSDCHGDADNLLLGTVKLPYLYVERLKGA